MDKYEYKLKLDQIKALAAEGNYAAAAEIADTINWRKVKNVNLLVKAGDVYTKQKRFEEAKEILFMAYDRSPIRRMIVYRLAEIAIKMKNLEEAEEYYDEFVEAAPRDNLKYVLRFKISKAKGADIQTLIAILEELKEAEYTEEWAYQLAFLYHKAGEVEKCIETCDDLVLWFGDGVYVERALELKMLYQPLTKSQEGKYRSLKQRRDGVKEVYPQEENVVRIPIVQENIEKFNTANLQEELAKSMQQIMDATEQETVDDTMDSIKKMVDEIPYLKMPHHEEAAEQAFADSGANAEMEYSLRDSYREILAEDKDGQYHMLVNDGAKESQVDGQMSIEDVLSDWEKTGRAIQEALKMAEQQKLESAKAKALQEVGDVMERLVEVMPKLDAGITSSQLLQEQYLSGDDASYEERTGQLVANVNDMLQQQIDRLQEEAMAEKEAQEREVREKEMQEREAPKTAIQEAQIQETRVQRAAYTRQMPRAAEAEEESENGAQPDLLRKLKRAKPNFDEQIGLRPYQPRQFGRFLDLESGQEQAEESLSQPQEAERENLQTEEAASITDELTWGMTEEELLEEKRLAEAEFYGISPDLLPKETEEMPQIALPEDIEAETALLKQDTKEIKSKKIEAAFEAQQKRPVEELEEIDETETEQAVRKKHEITKLDDEQKKIFSYFVPVAGMEEQICRTLTNVSTRLAGKPTSAVGNIVIQGESGCGKTVLATAIVKALQREVDYPNGKVAKVEAKALNTKDISKLFQKIQGGGLIIERASELSHETAVKLSLLLENDSSGILLMMEDTRTGLEQALGQDEGFARKFTERIKIPVFTSDELVEFGKAYAHDLDYEIDNMGVLALYNRISNIQRLDQATTLTEVKEIIDGAIENAEKKGLKKALSILTSRRYTEDDYVILREKDFEE